MSANGGKPWTQADYDLLADLRREGLGFPDIARRLGRTKDAVEYVWKHSDLTPRKRARTGHYVAPSTRVEPSTQEIAERDRAFAAPLSLNCELLGDPPPGRSALDRRALRLVAAR